MSGRGVGEGVGKDMCEGVCGVGGCGGGRVCMVCVWCVGGCG